MEILGTEHLFTLTSMGNLVVDVLKSRAIEKGRKVKNMSDRDRKEGAKSGVS